MSLVPYQPQEGREIVLRHRNAIVVHDPTSQRLEIRGIDECPTCHRPLRTASSPERPHFGDDAHHHGGGGSGTSSSRHEGYVDPNYFRLLRAGNHVGQLRAVSSSPPPPGAPGSSSRPGGGGGGGGGPQGPTGAGSPLRGWYRTLVGEARPDTGAGETRYIRYSRESTPALGEDDSFSSVDEVYDHPHGPPTGSSMTSTHGVPRDAEFVSSAPYVVADASSPINKDAFSPNYFRTFFVEERELGRGGKGVVLLVRHEIDGCQLGHFACKRVPVGDDHAWLEKVLVEVELLAKLSHPNLVSYRHVWLENVTLNRFGPSVACAFILQQYCNGGDLHRYVLGDVPKEATKEELKARMRRRSKGQAELPDMQLGAGGGSGGSGYRHLAFDEIYSLFKDVTSGLAYLHAANYIHRDLKPSNCLLHREGRSALTCLISDFGEVQAENVARKSTGTTGTISYCAPEVLRRDAASGLYGNFTTKSDVFSLGMILYFMCFGRLPYRSANAVHEELEDVDELRAEIANWSGFQYERRERPDLPAKLYELLTRMLSVNPAERPSASEVLLAMRTDGGIDAAGMGSFGSLGSGGAAATAAAAAASIGLGSRRIQNLDSPVPPSTPDLTGPRSSTRTRRGSPGNRASPFSYVEDLDAVDSAIVDADDGSAASLFLRPRNAHKRHKSSTSTSTSLALARTRSGGSADADESGANTTSADMVQQGSAQRLSPAPQPAQTARQNAILLMPPATTFWGEVRHHALVAQYDATVLAHRHAAALAFLFRTALFLAKMASLTKPCWPFMVRFEVGASLVAVAGFDLGVPSSNRSSGSFPRWDWRVSVLLLVLHFVVLRLAAGTGVLCSTGRPETWDVW